MSTVIPIRAPHMAFDFGWEAAMAAVNEACTSDTVCNLDKLCPECSALAIQIRVKLELAFLAGQASMQPKEDAK